MIALTTSRMKAQSVLVSGFGPRRGGGYAPGTGPWTVLRRPLDHENGRRGRSWLLGPPRLPARRGLPPTTVSSGRSYDLRPFDASGGESMGAYCTRALIPRHSAKVGEVIRVLWSDYHGAALF